MHKPVRRSDECQVTATTYMSRAQCCLRYSTSLHMNIQREQDIKIICLKKTCSLQNCQVWISSEMICSFICLLTTEHYKPVIYKVKLHCHLNSMIKLSQKWYPPRLGSRGWQRLRHAGSVSLSAQQHQGLLSSTFGGTATEFPTCWMDFNNQFLAVSLKVFIG